MTWTTWSTRLFLAGLLGAAALTLLIPAAPDYDAWAYLTWGRELAHFDLSTTDGPAFKPLPVLICAPLSALGDAAPDAWLVVVRAGALAAVALAGLLAFELVRAPTGSAQLAPGAARTGEGVEASGRRSGGGVGAPGSGRPGLALLAAVAAAAAVAFSGGFVRHAAGGDAEPLLVAFALGAWQRHRAGRRGQALALAVLAALCRVETWPFLLAYALVTIGRRRASALMAAVVAAWLLPELAGSGELLRSSERASVPNPGAPATAEVPLLASLGDAAALLPLPLAVFALATLARRRAPAALPLAAGVAWCLLVAAMAELGFSGEARYAMPGAAVIGVSAGVGLALAAARHPRARAGAVAAVAAAAIVALTAALGVRELDGLRGQLEYRADLASGLTTAIERAGGRDALLACGRPAVGRYRGTMAAYALGVHKQRVRADGRPDAVTLRSRLGPRDPVEPPPHGRLIAAAGPWRIETTCPTTAGR